MDVSTLPLEDDETFEKLILAYDYRGTRRSSKIPDRRGRRFDDRERKLSLSGIEIRPARRIGSDCGVQIAIKHCLLFIFSR